jgi:protein-S-isoprenylcysteine O-methyltransferase Ste14
MVSRREAGMVAGLFLALMVGTPFLSAGRIDWREGWLFLALVAVGAIGSHLFVKARNPEVLRHRRSIGEGTKPWDRVWLGLFRLMLLGLPIVAGLDAVRYGWTNVPWWLSPIGVILVLLGFALSALAMAENPHFEGTVRIQHDRDHRVIDTGPYAVVRHPGYVGVAMIVMGLPLVLRSGWALAVAFISVLWLGLRTWLEDRTLQTELSGYAEYAERVRARLLPGVW